MTQMDLFLRPVAAPMTDRTAEDVRLFADIGAREDLWDVRARHDIQLKDQIKLAPRLIEAMISSFGITKEEIEIMAAVPLSEAVKTPYLLILRIRKMKLSVS